jgi:mycothiol synthase
MPLSVVRPDAPDAAQLAAITALIAAVTEQDGREALSDQALTQLAAPSAEHAVAVDGDRLVGYAQLDGASLEIAAEVAAIGPLLDAFADRDVLVWSHGARSRLAPALSARGFDPVRELHQLRRSLTEPVAVPAPPDGVLIAPFVVGRDEDAWLAVNAAAFAEHPEQGGWSRADLQAREREAWFDPDGFLLAWRGAELLGFHWTKIHPDGAGEVYVIGVAPGAQGIGLGSVLLQQGLASLRTRGCPDVLLYVDGSNTTAMRLYERVGFARHDLDVQWRAPAPDGR